MIQQQKTMDYRAACFQPVGRGLLGRKKLTKVSTFCMSRSTATVSKHLHQIRHFALVEKSQSNHVIQSKHVQPHVHSLMSPNMECCSRQANKILWVWSKLSECSTMHQCPFGIWWQNYDQTYLSCICTFWRQASCSPHPCHGLAWWLHPRVARSNLEHLEYYTPCSETLASWQENIFTKCSYLSDSNSIMLGPINKAQQQQNKKDKKDYKRKEKSKTNRSTEYLTYPIDRKTGKNLNALIMLSNDARVTSAQKH